MGAAGLADADGSFAPAVAAAVEAAALVAVVLLLAAAAAALRLAMRHASSIWQAKGSVLAVCVLRLGAAMAFAALAPGGMLPLRLEHLLPTSGAAAAWVPIVLRFMNPEALLLAASALLLPLPLKHHLWTQGLAVRSVLGRMLTLATAHAAQPGGGDECAAFVRGARLAVLAVVPGSPVLDLPVPQAARQCCWMAHTWTLVVLGFCLPTAVGLALDLNAARQQRSGSEALGEAQEGERSDEGLEHAAAKKQLRRQHYKAAPEAAPKTVSLSDDGANAGPSTADSGLAALSRLRVRSRHSSRHSSSSESLRAEDVLVGSSWDSSESSRRSMLSQQSTPPKSPPRHHIDHVAVAMAARLGRWLVLLPPVGAVVWACLELAGLTI